MSNADALTHADLPPPAHAGRVGGLPCAHDCTEREELCTILCQAVEGDYATAKTAKQLRQSRCAAETLQKDGPYGQDKKSVLLIGRGIYSASLQESRSTTGLFLVQLSNDDDRLFVQRRCWLRGKTGCHKQIW